MLTQTISVYDEPPEPVYNHNWHSTYNRERSLRETAHSAVAPNVLAGIHRAVPPFTRLSTKAYYAEWIKTIPFKRGVYVTSRNNTGPYQDSHYFRVVQIQEIHLFCQFDAADRPMPMELCDSLGNRFFTNVETWKRIPVPFDKTWTFETPPV